MVVTTSRRSRFARLLAVFIIALVVSPYSEPFATIDGTDFSGAGAVDVVSAAKATNSTDDVLAVPAVLAVFLLAGSVSAVQPLGRFVTNDSPRRQRAILRL
jgi:hypothetical protein